MTFSLPPVHHHVTEREVAHYWPDGQWDNGRWEDCGWTSAVEFARLCFRASIPATHAEVEHLRDDSGEPPGGGSNSQDLLVGLRRRYGYTGIRTVQGFWSLKSALKIGVASCVQGSMGAFPRSHRLRRFDRMFAGPHNVLVMRLDKWDRVWWCDPLAPEDGYQGEWVTFGELKRFVDAAPGTHLYDNVKMVVTPVPPQPPPHTEDALQFIQAYDPPKKLDVPAGTQIYLLDGKPYTKLNGAPGSIIVIRTTGLADAHSGQFGVLIDTGGLYADNQQRLTELFILLPGGKPR